MYLSAFIVMHSHNDDLQKHLPRVAQQLMNYIVECSLSRHHRGLRKEMTHLGANGRAADAGGSASSHHDPTLSVMRGNQLCDETEILRAITVMILCTQTAENCRCANLSDVPAEPDKNMACGAIRGRSRGV
jgi:hypothetical protein